MSIKNRHCSIVLYRVLGIKFPEIWMDRARGTEQNVLMFILKFFMALWVRGRGNKASVTLAVKMLTSRQNKMSVLWTLIIRCQYRPNPYLENDVRLSVYYNQQKYESQCENMSCEAKTN